MDKSIDMYWETIYNIVKQDTLLANIEESDIMIDNEKMILDILKEKEMYGYEIVVRLNKDPESSIEYKIGTLYPILRSLEKRRILKAYEIKKNGKSRIYYKRTRMAGGGSNES